MFYQRYHICQPYCVIYECQINLYPKWTLMRKDKGVLLRNREEGGLREIQYTALKKDSFCKEHYAVNVSSRWIFSIYRKQSVFLLSGRGTLPTPLVVRPLKKNTFYMCVFSYASFVCTSSINCSYESKWGERKHIETYILVYDYIIWTYLIYQLVGRGRAFIHC